MSSLVSPADVRVLVQTSVPDADLQSLIDRVESEVVRHFGPHYATGQTVTEMLDTKNMGSLYLRRRLSAVTSIKEQSLSATTTLVLTSVQYRVWGEQGRVERLPRGSSWADLVEITYTPENDNARRKSVIIDLVRLALSRTVMRSESVGGEYSYSAPEWEQERAGILSRLLLR